MTIPNSFHARAPDLTSAPDLHFGLCQADENSGDQSHAPQFATLSILKENPDINQATLEGLFAHDRPTIGGAVDRLVARQINPAGRRDRMLQLTGPGFATLERMTSIVHRLQDEILPGLTDKKRKDFVRLASKAAQAGNEL